MPCSANVTPASQLHIRSPIIVYPDVRELLGLLPLLYYLNGDYSESTLYSDSQLPRVPTTDLEGLCAQSWRQGSKRSLRFHLYVYLLPCHIGFRTEVVSNWLIDSRHWLPPRDPVLCSLAQLSTVGRGCDICCCSLTKLGMRTMCQPG